MSDVRIFCSSDGNHGVLDRNGLHPRIRWRMFCLLQGSEKAEHDGNKRKAIILGIASIAILITGFVIDSQFGIFSTTMTMTMATN